MSPATAIRIRAFALVLALASVGAPARAEGPLAITHAYNFRDTILGNLMEYRYKPGDVQRVGVAVNHSDLPTEVTATQNGTMLTLPRGPSPAEDDHYEIAFPYDPALIGPWVITVTRGTDIATIVTPGLLAPLLAPAVENLQVTDPYGLPQLVWTWPDFGAVAAGSAVVAVRLGVTEVETYDEFDLRWGPLANPVVVGLPGEAFAIDVAGGLETGRLNLFWVVVLAVDQDGNTLARSRSFARRLFSAL